MRKKIAMGNYFSPLGLVASKDTTIVTQVRSAGPTQVSAAFLSESPAIQNALLPTTSPPKQVIGQDGNVIATNDSPTGPSGTTGQKAACLATPGNIWIGLDWAGVCQTPAAAEKGLNDLVNQAKGSPDQQQVEDFVQQSCLQRGGNYVAGTCRLPTVVHPDDLSEAIPQPGIAGALKRAGVSPALLVGGGLVLAFLLLRRKS